MRPRTYVVPCWAAVALATNSVMNKPAMRRCIIRIPPRNMNSENRSAACTLMDRRRQSQAIGAAPTLCTARVSRDLSDRRCRDQSAKSLRFSKRNAAPAVLFLTRLLPAGARNPLPAGSLIFPGRETSMARLVSSILLFCAAILAAASPVQAQYGARTYNDRATGESYHVELGGYFWNPAPEIGIVSEGLGIPGDRVDFVTDLGIEQSQFRQLKVVLRPATKHKFRFEYTPISYSAEGTIRRDVIFNGIIFPVALPVQTDMTWKAYRIGYELDFITRDRGFLGLVLKPL